MIKDLQKYVFFQKKILEMRDKCKFKRNHEKELFYGEYDCFFSDEK